MASVLIVEDDAVLADSMAAHLAGVGLEALRVSDGKKALARLRYERPTVCVLDLMLPEVDGWTVIETVRNEGIGTPVVVVSARGTEHDRVHALQIGADDYLVKPFSMKELVARVQAAVRRGVRTQEPEPGEAVQIEELLLDPDNVQAYVDGQSAELTPTEFRLLYALALTRGRVATRDELLQRVWGRRAGYRDRTVDVFVRKLRNKIDRPAPRHTFIQTRYGVGYKLDPVLKPLCRSAADIERTRGWALPDPGHQPSP
jgi:DNA-binding response OmpR family regulator